MYLEYGEYEKIGGTLCDTAFNRFAYKAEGIITNATFGRVKQMTETPESVKHLERDLIEYLNINSPMDKKVASESQNSGGVSESVNYVALSDDDIAKAIDEMIRDYLLSETDDNETPLLCRGIRS